MSRDDVKPELLTGPTHRSPSQYNTLAACEVKYYYSKVLRLPQPLSAPLLLGRATDEAVMLNFDGKKQTGRDEPVKRVKEKYVAEFDGGRKDVDWSREDERPLDLRDSGMKPLEKYHTEYCPSIVPVEVQPDLGMENTALGIRIVQFGDVLTKDGKLIDVKTSKSSPPSVPSGGFRPKSEDHEFQVICYDLGHRAKYGKPPTQSRLDYLIHTKEPKVVSVPVIVGPAQVKYFGTVADRMERRLQWLNATAWAGALPNRRHFLCSKKYCPYAAQCEKDHGGRVRD